MICKTIGLGLTAMLFAAPVLAQSQTYRTQPQPQTTRVESERLVGDQRVAVDDLKERYATVADQRETVATKLSAADYQELARQRAQLDTMIRRLEAGQRSAGASGSSARRRLRRLTLLGRRDIILADSARLDRVRGASVRPERRAVAHAAREQGVGLAQMLERLLRVSELRGAPRR